MPNKEGLYTFEELYGNVTGDLREQKASNFLDKFEGATSRNTLDTKEIGTLQQVKYDIPTDAIYDRLNDGTYVPKFENYTEAFGNEDRLAKEQGGFEQLASGVYKNARKMGNYILDATLGTVNGVLESISQQRLSAFYDNDFSKKLDDWNKELDYSIPNYRTDEEKSMNILEKLTTPMAWGNFLGDDVGGAFAFVGGALLPELALAALTGGATIGGSLAKTGFKLGLKGALKAEGKSLLKTAGKELLEEVGDVSNYSNIKNVTQKARELDIFEKGVDLQRAARYSSIGRKVGGTADWLGFVARTSGFEAGMEARHNLKEATDNFYTKFQEDNGRMPTTEESNAFMEDALTASNGVFGANMAILAVSNTAMFGSKLGIKLPELMPKGLTQKANRLIGLGTETAKTGEIVISGANKAQRFLGNSYKVLSKPAVEGIWEEGIQGTVGKTMQNYLNSKYHEDNSPVSLWGSFTDGFKEQYGTKEGWDEIGIGMLVGFAGGTVSGQGLSGFGKNSRKAAQTQLQKEVETANKGVLNLRAMNYASAAKVYKTQMQRAEETGGTPSSIGSIEGSVVNRNFIKSQAHIKTTKQIQEDYENTIDNASFDEATVQELGHDNVEAFKENLKLEFKQSVSDYKAADKIVRNLGLDGKFKGSNGDLYEVADTVQNQIYMGRNALSQARRYSDGLADITGEDGMFSAMSLYNNLTAEQKTSINELQDKQDELKKLRDTAIDLGRAIAGVSLDPSYQNRENPDLVREYNDKSEQLVMTNNRVIELEKEISNRSEVLNTDFQNIMYDMQDIFVDGNPQGMDVLEAIDRIGKIDKVADAFRKSGKTSEADSLEYMVTQFKALSDLHRETDNMVRKMADSNFFSSKEGGSLLDKILGTDYEMSEDLREALKENDDIIDRSLNMVGIRDYGTVEDIIKKNIVDNPDISRREKQKLDTLLRIQLGLSSTRKMAEDLGKQIVEQSVEDIRPSDPKLGDTLEAIQQLRESGDNLDALQVLEKTINTILSQIDYLRQNGARAERLKKLTTKLETLKQKRDKLVGEQNTEEDAVEETEQETVLPEGSGIQHQGTDEGQQEGGVTEGEQGETQTPEAGSSDSSQSSEEKEQRARVLDKLNTDISQIEKEIEDISQGTRLIDSPEYKRLDELFAASIAGEITEQEQGEIDELRQDIDNWLLVTGTVVNGVRLSDLMKQKIALEKQVISEEGQIDVSTNDQILDSTNIFDGQAPVYYTLSNSPFAVTSRNVNEDGEDFVLISGILPENFSEFAGVEVDFKVNDRNNVVLTQEQVDEINTGDNIRIVTTTEQAKRNYSIVMNVQKDVNGNIVLVPAQSDYSTDFPENDFDPESIYSTEPGSKITLEIHQNDKANAELRTEYSRAASLPITDVTRGAKINAVKQKARESALVRIVNPDGIFIGYLKSKRTEGEKTEIDLRYEVMRDTLFEDESLLDQLLDPASNLPLEIDNGLKVKRNLIGYPNFIIIEKADGSHYISSKRITEGEAKNILDVGYVQDGTITTKNKIKGINTTFVNSAIRSKKKSKTPFVVLKKGDMLIAYPVNILERKEADTDEFENIFNSGLASVDKAIKLNKMMAENGINTRERGNAFTVIGSSNLTQEFFNKKLAQMKNMKYYYSAEKWMDDTVKIEDIAREQISINVDINNPVHSPKIELDLSGVKLEIPQDMRASVATRKAATAAKTKNISGPSKLVTMFAKDMKNEADGELNTEC